MFPLTRRAERASRRETFPLARLRDEMDATFERMLGGWMPPEDEFSEALPSWEWEEGEKEVVLRAPVAGFKPEEVEVKLLGNELTVHAEHKEEAKEKGGRTRRYGRFERMVRLPAGIDPAKVEAHLRNGMLEIHLPRAPGAAPRKIEVKT
jgi:HSP20 family protein